MSRNSLGSPLSVVLVVSCLLMVASTVLAKDCKPGEVATICKRRRNGRERCISRISKPIAGYKITGSGRKKKCCLIKGGKGWKNCYRASRRRTCWGFCKAPVVVSNDSTKSCSFGQAAVICKRRNNGKTKCITRKAGDKGFNAGFTITDPNDKKRRKCCLTGGAHTSPLSKKCYRGSKRRTCWGYCTYL